MSVKKHLLYWMMMLLFLNSNAQKTAFYLDKEEFYKNGIELFDKKQFNAAQKHFEDYIKNTPTSLLKTDALYYAAACGIELFHKDGEWRMKQFLEKYPESIKRNSALFYLGKSNFRKKKYQETLEYLEKTDSYQLSSEDLAEFHFKRGYSFFMAGNNEKAKEDLAEIKDKENKYMYPAIYYYSHILYAERKYETALAGFQKLTGNETFGSVVPYYITQIYFIQGKYLMVTQTAPDLLNDSVFVQKANEINRMIGESYYNLKDYVNALTFLKKTDLGSGYNHQGNYAMGYCYYKTNDCPNAVKQLEKATEAKDSLSQSAWYHMADCYLKMGDKLKAKNAFYGAYQLKHDPKIVEDALFSFAKLSYELDFSPYNEAVKAFSQYLKEYPANPKKDECYSYLINVYSTTKNYDQAIKSIESMESINPMLKYTYQKLIYFRGVDAFNNANYDVAEKQFQKSLSQNSDLTLNSLNHFWLGEIAYIRKDYSTAIELWKKFLVMEGSIALPEYESVNYNIGYAYFMRRQKDDFTEANLSFRKYLLSKNLNDLVKKSDANLRAADCHFMNKNFLLAIDFYSEAIKLNKLDVEYAIFQRGICYGLIKKHKEKIEDLITIEKNYPKSIYISQVLNEIADTYYENLREEENAITYYNKILKSHPNSAATQNCYAKLGNIYYGRKEDDKAFDYFDKFVRYDSKTEEAKNILEQIKNIFKEKGKIEEMEKYFAELGNPLNVNQIELATYDAAKDAQFNQKNIDLAMDKWQAYINRFPDGKYILEAQFNYAECAYSKNLPEKAMPGYEYVISKSRSLYTETALAIASYVNYKNKNYSKALPQFFYLRDIAESALNKTNARFGIMRSAYYLNKYDTAIAATNDLMTNEKLFPQQIGEIKYIKARCLYETGSLDDALIEFKSISKSSKNITGAEAYYYIAAIYFKKKDYKEVEKNINSLMSFQHSNDDWNNKGMLLLADCYTEKGENADAIIILETIISSKPKQVYLDEANLKLQKLKEKQQSRSEGVENNKEMKVEFDNGNGSFDGGELPSENSGNKTDKENNN